jgi:hypothetical protein
MRRARRNVAVVAVVVMGLLLPGSARAAGKGRAEKADEAREVLAEAPPPPPGTAPVGGAAPVGAAPAGSTIIATPPPAAGAPPPATGTPPPVPGASPPAQPAPVLVAQPAPASEQGSVVSKPWFWIAVGGVVAAAIVTSILLAGRDPSDPKSTITPVEGN